MVYVEQIDRGKVLALNDGNFDRIHKPYGGHGKVITNHHDRLHLATVALPHRSDQVGLLLAAMRVQPLFELVQDDDDLGGGGTGG